MSDFDNFLYKLFISIMVLALILVVGGGILVCFITTGFGIYLLSLIK